MTELVRRGHRVTVAVPAPFAAIAASTGATPLVYRSLLDEAQHVFPQLVDALEQDRPDAVLYDIAAYSARVLAWRWDVPLVRLSPVMIAWDGYEQDMAETLAPIRRTRTTSATRRCSSRTPGWAAVPKDSARACR